MIIRALTIHLILGEGIRGRVSRTNNLKVIEATKVDNLIPIRVTNLIPQPTNKADNPRRTRLLELVNRVLIAGPFSIIHMNVPFYVRCIRKGKIKHLLLEDLS